MLASIINYDGDIHIFLSDEEVKLLGTNSLTGYIFEMDDIRNTYPLEIRLEQEDKNFGYTASRDIIENEYVVSLRDIVSSDSSYETLKTSGCIGTMYGRFKIDIMTENCAQEDKSFSNELQFLQNRWDNRDKVIEKLNREEKLKVN